MNKLTAIYITFLIGLTLAISGRIMAQGTISVESEVDKSTITIGDRIHYTLTVKHSPDVQVEMPAFGINLGQFEIQDYQVTEPEKVDGQLIEAITYRISIYDIGDYTIPPVIVKYTAEGDSIPNELQSEEIAILVESVNPSEAEDIKEIKDPLIMPPDYAFYYWLAGLAGLLILIIAAIYIYMKKFKKVDLPFFASAPPRPAHEIAYEALDKLEKSGLLAERNLKKYYVQISGIIRVYLAGRYEIDVLEMTTTELTEALLTVYDIDERQIDMIRDFLNQSDLVKFAKYFPSDGENEQIMPTAREIVDKTKRIFVEPPSMTPVDTQPPQAAVPEKMEVAA